MSAKIRAILPRNFNDVAAVFHRIIHHNNHAPWTDTHLCISGASICLLENSHGLWWPQQCHIIPFARIPLLLLWLCGNGCCYCYCSSFLCCALFDYFNVNWMKQWKLHVAKCSLILSVKRLSFDHFVPSELRWIMTRTNRRKDPDFDWIHEEKQS